MNPRIKSIADDYFHIYINSISYDKLLIYDIMQCFKSLETKKNVLEFETSNIF